MAVKWSERINNTKENFEDEENKSIKYIVQLRKPLMFYLNKIHSPCLVILF